MNTNNIISISPTSQKDFISSLPMRYLSELLPENENGVHKSLGEYALLLIALVCVIEALEKGELNKFDALVCENQCQVRAIMILLNHRECLFGLSKIKASVEASLEKIMMLMEMPLNGFSDIENLLKTEALEIPLYGREFVFVELYLLTIVKQETGNFHHPDKTYLPYLKKLAPKKWAHFIGNKFTDKLTKFCRKQVSRLSKPFFQQRALICGDNVSSNMLERVVYIEERECTPCNWITEIMTQTLFHEGISVVQWVHQKNKQNKLIKEFCIYYESDSKNKRFVQKSPLLIDASKAVLVVKGVAIKDEKTGTREISHSEILQLSLDNYFRLHGGSHRQFPNEALDYLVEDTPDSNYHFYKEQAVKWRCTQDDPQLFHIFHIYADTIGNVKPIRHEINAYLEATYGDFYRSVESKWLKEIIEQLQLKIVVDVVGKKLMIKSDELDELNVICKHLFFSPTLLHKFPRMFKFYKHPLPLELKVEWNRYEPLKLAVNHPNPVQFLVDHCSTLHYFDIPEVIGYFVDNPESLKEPDVLNIFFEYLLQRYPDGYSETGESILVLITRGLAMALYFPESRKRALNMLVHAASSYEEEAYSYSFESYHRFRAFFVMSRRSKARAALKPVYHTIRPILQEMFEAEKVPHLKLELLNILEGSDHLADQLHNGDIIKDLAATWKFEKGKTDSEQIIQELLELIRSDETSKDLRIVAIRYLFHYFLSSKEEIDIHCLKGSFSLLHPRHSSLRKEITQFLKELAKGENVDADIRREASSMLNLIVEHLQKILANNHPSPEVRAELPELIQYLNQSLI